MPAPVFQYMFLPELRYCPCPPRKSFSPRFDVRETTNAYIVEGELPSIADKSNISLEFTDKGDLIVRGRVDRSRTTVVLQAQPQTSSPSQETNGKGKEREDRDEDMVPAPTYSAPTSPQSLKPMVEDVPDEDDWMGIVESSTEKTGVEGETAEKKEQPRAKVAKKGEWPKRLLSERSTGGFARSFSFPAVIDHDAV
ncbi:hypothetical protein C7212DRAFT_330311, partial [Tuber magnatum]